MSPVIQLQSALPNTEMSSAATPRPSVRLVQPGLRWFNPSPGSAFPFVAVVRCLFPILRSACCASGIQTQNSRSHVAMSYRPSIAWKASLRAHRRRFARPLLVLKPRWSEEPLNAARTYKYQMAERRQSVNLTEAASLSSLLQHCTLDARNQDAEFPRRIARVTKKAALRFFFVNPLRSAP